MPIATDDAWRPLTACGDVRVLKYSWGPANANALAIRLRPGGWLVVSPPRAAPPGVHEELAADGGVQALLAPNAYHYLGQAAWRRRFPTATSWAPSGALERIAKKTNGAPFGRAEDFVDQLPDNISLVLPAGQKKPRCAAVHHVANRRGSLVARRSVLQHHAGRPNLALARVVTARRQRPRFSPQHSPRAGLRAAPPSLARVGAQRRPGTPAQRGRPCSWRSVAHRCRRAHRRGPRLGLGRARVAPPTGFGAPCSARL